LVFPTTEQHPAQFKFVHAGTVEFAKASKHRVNVAAARLDAATEDREVKMTEGAKKIQRAAEKQEVRLNTARGTGLRTLL
jgi:hypothetical protein